MKIFYFTGTGNSLAAAKRLKGEWISIPQVMKTGSFVFEDEEIGVIFPLYCLNPPKMVRTFLSKAQFHTEYLFAVATYGNLAGASMQELQRSLRPYGYQFHYMNTLLMVDNFLPNFEINEEISLLKKKKTEECLEKIAADIHSHRHYIPRPTQIIDIRIAMCVSLMAQQDKGENAKAFLVNRACISCGICVRVCPANNITLEKRPIFHDQCESCYACIHACPKNAIHLPNEKSNVRWRNPAVTLEELIRSNQ